jgi:hypothetical protein
LGHFGARRMIGNPWKIQVYDLSLYEWNSVPNGCYSIKSKWKSNQGSGIWQKMIRWGRGSVHLAA